MSSFRWILLTLGIILLAGIYLFEVRRTAKMRKEQGKTEDPVFEDLQEQNAIEENLQDDWPALHADDDLAAEAADLELSELTELIKGVVNLAPDDPSFSATRADLGPQAATVTRKTAVPEKSLYLINGSIIVLHLLARHPDGMQGAEIRNVFGEMNILHGKKSIFHYHHKNGEVLFSIANLVEPGVFDLSAMDIFKTPGLTLFMLLDNLDNPRQGFEILLQVVWKLSGRLDARICDAGRNPVNQQTMADMLEEVKAYQAVR